MQGGAASLGLLLLGTLAAGCLSGPAGLSEQASLPGSAVENLAARVRALVGPLPCEASVGDGTSANLAEVATAALDEEGSVGVAELWLQGSLAYVARYGTGGFTIVDIADPLNPVPLASWDPEETDRGLDVKTTSDGAAALVGGDRGVKIVDVRDPRSPRLEHEHRFAKPQAHMLTVFQVEGQDYVAAAKGDGQDLPIFRVAGEPGQHTLEPVSSPKLMRATQPTGVWNAHDLARTHDAFFFEDPLLGKPTLWVANVWEGIVALDVSSPEEPREIAWIPNLNVQYTHTVQTVVLDAQEPGKARRITVSMAEVGYNTMKVYDTTDLASPRLLAEWSVREAWRPQHNLQVVPPFIYLAHYNQGVFVFRLSDALAGSLEPVARLASTGAERRVQGSPLTTVLGAALDFGGTWDVGLRDGLVYATDGALRIAAFGCLEPGDDAMTSVG